jgi:hypothetical protein
MNSDILSEILMYLSGDDISSLSSTSKISNIQILNILKDKLFIKRIDFRFDEAQNQLEKWFKNNKINDSTTVYRMKSLLCRILDIDDRISNESLRNNKKPIYLIISDDLSLTRPDGGFPKREDINPYARIIITLVISGYFDELLQLCYLFQNRYMSYIEGQTLGGCFHDAFINHTAFFAKYLCYGVIMDMDICDWLAKFSIETQDPLKRLLLELERLGSYSHSFNISITIASYERLPDSQYNKLFEFLLPFMIERRMIMEDSSGKIISLSKDSKYPFNKLIKKIFTRSSLHGLTVKGYDIQNVSQYSIPGIAGSVAQTWTKYQELERVTGKVSIRPNLSIVGLRLALDYAKRNPYAIDTVFDPARYFSSNFDFCDLLLEIRNLNDEEYFSILEQSIEKFDIEVCQRLLLDSRAKSFILSANLKLSSTHPNTDEFLQMITINPPFNIDPIINDAALIAVKSDVKNLPSLLKYIDLESVGSELVDQAIKGRNMESLKLLLKEDFELDDELTANAIGDLSKYQTKPELDIIDVLVNDGRFDVTGNDNGAIILATKYGYINTIRKLIKQGADPSARNNTALKLLAKTGRKYGDEETRMQIVKVLMKSRKVSGDKKAVAEAIKLANGVNPEKIKPYKKLAKLIGELAT